MRRWLILLGLLPLFGLVELALHLWFAGRAPKLEDYARLAPELLSLKKPGQPVVVSPRWAEPLVRQAAEGAFPLGELARADDSGFRRLLEVSLLGATDAALADFAVSERRRIGPFELRVRENPKHEQVTFDFVSAVERREVEVFNDIAGSRTACRFVERAHTSSGGLHGHVAYPRGRFECASGRCVGVTLIEDREYRPRRCVLAQPPALGSLVLRFTAAPISQRLVGWAGFSYFLGRDGAGGPVAFAVNVGAEELGRHLHNAERGWSRFEFSRAAAESSAGPSPIELTLTSNQSEVSDFCFALEARR